MKKKVLIILILGLFGITTLYAQESVPQKGQKDVNLDLLKTKPEEKLVILWTSGDPEVAENMVFMYAYNAKKNNWWKDITFIVWGPSAQLLSENKELQELIKKMIDEGIHVEACKACADRYRVSDKLSQMGIDVRYLGEPLTEYIKEGRHVITF